MTTVTVDTVATDETQAPIYSFKNVKEPFKEENDHLFHGQTSIIRHIGRVSIINNRNRAVIPFIDMEAFDELLVELMTSGRIIKRVNDYSDFFDGEKQFEALKIAEPDDALSFAQEIGLPLRASELAIVKDYNDLKNRIVDFFKAPVSKYKFVDKPANETKLTIVNRGNGKRSVRNFNGYQISDNQCKKIWEVARACWSGDKKSTSTTVNHSGYGTRHVTISGERVNIGCQSVSRWQVEQAARDLDFI